MGIQYNWWCWWLEVRIHFFYPANTRINTNLQSIKNTGERTPHARTHDLKTEGKKNGKKTHNEKREQKIRKRKWLQRQNKRNPIKPKENK